MIERIIDWCASNRFLVFTGTVVLTVWGIWAMTQTPLDAVPGHLRRAGDCLDGVDGAESRPHRGSDHLSDRDRADFDAARQGRSRIHRLRDLLRLRHLSGRHRHVLGAQPRRRVPAGHPRATAGRRQSGDWAGRDRRGLGVRVRAGGRNRPAQPGRPARLSGLAPALLAGVGAGRRRGGQHRRVREAVPGEHRSEQARGLQPRREGRHPGDQDEQQRRRGASVGVLGTRVHGPGAGIPHVPGGHRGGVTGRGPARHVHPRARRGAGAAGARHPSRRGGARRKGRSRWRHHRHALRRERAQGDRRRQGEASGGAAFTAARHDDRADLRSVRPSSATPSTRCGTRSSRRRSSSPWSSSSFSSISGRR